MSILCFCHLSLWYSKNVRYRFRLAQPEPVWRPKAVGMIRQDSVPLKKCWQFFCLRCLRFSHVCPFFRILSQSFPAGHPWLLTYDHPCWPGPTFAKGMSSRSECTRFFVVEMCHDCLVQFLGPQIQPCQKILKATSMNELHPLHCDVMEKMRCFYSNLLPSASLWS